jgi:hypothetical protein
MATSAFEKKVCWMKKKLEAGGMTRVVECLNSSVKPWVQTSIPQKINGWLWISEWISKWVQEILNESLLYHALFHFLCLTTMRGVSTAFKLLNVSGGPVKTQMFQLGFWKNGVVRFPTASDRPAAPENTTLEKTGLSGDRGLEGPGVHRASLRQSGRSP